MVHLVPLTQKQKTGAGKGSLPCVTRFHFATKAEDSQGHHHMRVLTRSALPLACTYHVVRDSVPYHFLDCAPHYTLFCEAFYVGGWFINQFQVERSGNAALGCQVPFGEVCSVQSWTFVFVMLSSGYIGCHLSLAERDQQSSLRRP